MSVQKAEQIMNKELTNHKIIWKHCIYTSSHNCKSCLQVLTVVSLSLMITFNYVSIALQRLFWNNSWKTKHGYHRFPRNSSLRTTWPWEIRWGSRVHWEEQTESWMRKMLSIYWWILYKFRLRTIKIKLQGGFQQNTYWNRLV